MNADIEVKSRRRSEAKHESILEAAAVVAFETGYSASTIELIAIRAAVGKQTIYRWWPSKAALYLETYKRLVEGVVMPESGQSCRQRLQRFLTALFRHYKRSSAGVILRGLIGEMASDDNVRIAVQSGLLLERSSVLLEPIQAGIDSGEIGNVQRAEDVADVIIALIWKQLLLEPDKLTERFAKRVVNAALGG